MQRDKNVLFDAKSFLVVICVVTVFSFIPMQYIFKVNDKTKITCVLIFNLEIEMMYVVSMLENTLTKGMYDLKTGSWFFFKTIRNITWLLKSLYAFYLQKGKGYFNSWKNSLLFSFQLSTKSFLTLHSPNIFVMNLLAGFQDKQVINWTI